MKFRFKHVLAGIFIFFFVISSACQKQKSGWQGTIEEENGIKVVNNPVEPLYGELVLELEEDLAIGTVEGENTTFYQIRDIAVDSQGNLYVLDSGNHRIQKFNKDGNYLQTIGRKGQGPGEFMRPYDIFLDERGNIYVSEGRRMNLFDPKGNSIKSFVINSFIMGFSVGSEGNIIAYGFVRAERGQNFGILTIDSEGKVTKTVAEFQGMQSVTRGDTMFSLSHEYTPQVGFSPVQHTGAVYGYTPEYTLYLADLLGDTLLIIKKDEPHHSITRKEKDKIIDEALDRTAQDGGRWPRDVVEEGANFPDHRPFFSAISSDDTGRIFVKKRKSVFDESEEVEFDIFSNEGYFLYTTQLPFTPILIKDSYLYKSTYLEETSEYKVIRYRIKNWDKIKVSK
jgi:hypothetical protein